MPRARQGGWDGHGGEELEAGLIVSEPDGCILCPLTDAAQRTASGTC
jgi:hypothetical protein